MEDAPDYTPKHALPVTIELDNEPPKRRLWIFPAALVGVVAAVYIGGSVYFMSHFLPNTSIGEQDVSLQPAAEIAELISHRSDTYSGTFHGEGFEIPFTASDIGFSFDGAAYTEEALSQQNPWTWPLAFNESHTLSATPTVMFDEDKAWELFSPIVEESKRAQAELPHRGVVFDEKADGYVLDDVAHAAMLDQASVLAQLKSALDLQAETIEISDECYVIDSETQAILDAANYYANAKVHLTMNGVDALDIDGKQISQWITIHDDGTVTLDEQAILDWGPGGLSDILDTVGKPRTYERPDGVEITVAGGGPYGWIINGAESAELILKAIKSGQPQTVDIPTIQNADRVDPGGQDWPDKYIDVDISEQKGRMYDNGELVWEADLVTGVPGTGRETPQGVFYVSEHETDVVLFNQGTVPDDVENPDPDTVYTDGWRSTVNYWVAYDGSVRGFHDSDWRTEFGDDIYLWNGSHGCINMGYESAEKLYNLTELGDAVIIHE